MVISSHTVERLENGKWGVFYAGHMVVSFAVREHAVIEARIIHDHACETAPVTKMPVSYQRLLIWGALQDLIKERGLPL